MSSEQKPIASVYGCWANALNINSELINNVENELKDLTLEFSGWKDKVQNGHIDSHDFDNEEYEKFVCQLVKSYDTICYILGYDSASKTLQALKDAIANHNTLMRNHCGT